MSERGLSHCRACQGCNDDHMCYFVLRTSLQIRQGMSDRDNYLPRHYLLIERQDLATSPGQLRGHFEFIILKCVKWRLSKGVLSSHSLVRTRHAQNGPAAKGTL
jgi:hypothetical protein